MVKNEEEARNKLKVILEKDDITDHEIKAFLNGQFYAVQEYHYNITSIMNSIKNLTNDDHVTHLLNLAT